MARKKWTPNTDITPSLIRFREKKKWQIALRRYLLERNPCIGYAPYFGLDIENFRKWIEVQFVGELGWDNFGTLWQFEHIIPVTYFDFEDELELKLCWSFINIRIEDIQKSKERGNRVDLLLAKEYFRDLFEATGYTLCKDLLKKISQIEEEEQIATTRQKEFINFHNSYLQLLKDFSSYEFELLNSGRDVEEVKKEADFIKKMGQHD
ncbi:MAG: hypothetical protein GXC73_05795 [Chitinophagaceae bacterium]|nr:hypothetical protein [Chitinophagaceae bacterium]